MIALIQIKYQNSPEIRLELLFSLQTKLRLTSKTTWKKYAKIITMENSTKIIDFVEDRPDVTLQ